MHYNVELRNLYATVYKILGLLWLSNHEEIRNGYTLLRKSQEMAHMKDLDEEGRVLFY
jgi:hypothetical protein